MPTKRTKTTSKKPERAAPSLSLAVQYAVDESALPTRAQFRRWVKAALTDAGAAQAAITLRIVGSVESRRLNTRYRRQRHATNVLSFAYDTEPSSRGRKILSGDIVLCAPVIAREARAQGKALAAHYAHLTVHGMLHLQGYDHQRDSDANRMERLETAILGRLGWPNPYLPGAFAHGPLV
jgi:probable rRNA maturation factor